MRELLRKPSTLWAIATIILTAVVLGVVVEMISWENLPKSATISILVIGILSAIMLYGYGYIRYKRQKHEQEKNNPNSKYYEQNAEKALAEHWNDLAILCQEASSRMDVPFSIDNRYSSFGRSLIGEGDDGIKALMCINHWEEMDAQIAEESESSISGNKKADWGLYSHLLTHLKFEDPQWENYMRRLKDTVIVLHNKLYALSEVAMSITAKWQIIITDWATVNEAIEAGELSSQLQERIRPMGDEILCAYTECVEAMSVIREKLYNVSKRRTFCGRCPSCP